MRRQMIVMLLLATGIVACRRDPKPPEDQPKHALLDSLKPPPLNKPIHQTSEKQQAAPVQLPAGPASALIAMRDGAPFVGDTTLDGRLTIDAKRIRIDQTAGGRLELIYRLPMGLPPLRAQTGNGTIAIHDRSGPAGADRRVVVRAESRAVLAEIWQRSLKPLDLDLGNGVRLVQLSAPASSKAGYTEAQLNVVEGDRVLGRVPIGRATQIQTASGRYAVFAEVSHLLIPSPASAGQVEGGYILRAWVVSAE